MATEQYSGINGMFGPSPEEVQQMRQAEIGQQARRDINLTPSQQAAVGYREAGGMLGDAIGGAMGFENPQVARAKKIQELIKDVDTTSSTSLLEAARKLNAAGLYHEAQLAANKGNELRKQEQVEAHAAAKEGIAERKQAASEGQDYELKKSQIEAAIRQRDESIANKATSDSDRVEAIRERNQLMLLIAQMRANANGADKPLTPAQKAKLVQTAGKSVGSLRAMDNDLDNMTEQANAIANHPSLWRSTGAIGALPSTPGGGAAEVDSLIDEFRASVKKTGLNIVRQGGGIGSVTEKEWTIVEGMVAAIKPGMKEEFIKEQMNKVLAKIEQVRQNAYETHNESFGSDLKATEKPARISAPPTATSSTDKFVAGKQYKDAKGNVATYLGNGQWK